MLITCVKATNNIWEMMLTMTNTHARQQQLQQHFICLTATTTFFKSIVNQQHHYNSWIQYFSYFFWYFTHQKIPRSFFFSFRFYNDFKQMLKHFFVYVTRFWNAQSEHLNRQPDIWTDRKSYRTATKKCFNSTCKHVKRELMDNSLTPALVHKIASSTIQSRW